MKDLQCETPNSESSGRKHRQYPARSRGKKGLPELASICSGFKANSLKVGLHKTKQNKTKPLYSKGNNQSSGEEDHKVGMNPFQLSSYTSDRALISRIYEEIK